MLEFFLYLNLFLAGIAVTLAGRFGWEQYQMRKNLTVPISAAKTHTDSLSDAARAKLMKDAEVAFRRILEHAAGELQYDLKATSDGISDKMKSLGDEIVQLEMKRYKASLEQLRQTTEESVGLAAAEVVKHQAELQAALVERQKELEASLEKAMEAEKDRLSAELDKKLAGSVTAFLVETLGHNVDLGAQSAYLTETLEKHKDELKKELKSDA